MSQETPRAVEDLGGEDELNVVAEELARVLWRTPDVESFNPPPQRVDIQSAWKELKELFKNNPKESKGAFSPKTVAVNLAGLLSSELAKRGVNMEEGWVWYISLRESFGSSWYSVVSQEWNVYHIPILWNQEIPGIEGDLKKLIGLIAGHMEAGDKIYLAHAKGKIVIFVEKELEGDNEIKKIVRVWVQSDELEFPGNELVWVYEFSYPLASGPLDPASWDAFGII